jgi:hypothetical protein
MDTVAAADFHVPGEILPAIVRVDGRALTERLKPAVTGTYNGQRIYVRERYSHLPRIGIRLEDLEGIPLTRARLAGLRLDAGRLSGLGFQLGPFTPPPEEVAALMVSDFGYLGPEREHKVLDYEVDWRELPELNGVLRRPDLEESLGTNQTTLRDFRRIGIDLFQLFTVPVEPRKLEALGLDTEDWLRMGLLPPDLETGERQLTDLRRIGWTLDSIHLYLEDAELETVAAALHARELSARAEKMGFTGTSIPLDTLLALCGGGPPGDSCSLDLSALGIRSVFSRNGRLMAAVWMSDAASVEALSLYDSAGTRIDRAGDTAGRDPGLPFRACRTSPCLAGFDAGEGKRRWARLAPRTLDVTHAPGSRGFLALAMDVDNFYSLSSPDWNVTLEIEGGNARPILLDTVTYMVKKRRGTGTEPKVGMLLALPAGTYSLSGFRGYGTRYDLRKPMAIRIDSGRFLSLGEWTYSHNLTPRRPVGEDPIPGFQLSGMPPAALRRLAAKQGSAADFRHQEYEEAAMAIRKPGDIRKPLATWIVNPHLGYPHFASLEAGLLAGFKPPRMALYRAARFTGELTPSGLAAHAGYMVMNGAPRNFFGYGYSLGVVWIWDEFHDDRDFGAWMAGPEASFILGEVGLRLAVPVWRGLGLHAGLFIHLDGADRD